MQKMPVIWLSEVILQDFQQSKVWLVQPVTLWKDWRGLESHIRTKPYISQKTDLSSNESYVRSYLRVYKMQCNYILRFCILLLLFMVADSCAKLVLQTLKKSNLYFKINDYGEKITMSAFIGDVFLTNIELY